MDHSITSTHKISFVPLRLSSISFSTSGGVSYHSSRILQSCYWQSISHGFVSSPFMLISESRVAFPEPTNSMNSKRLTVCNRTPSALPSSFPIITAYSVYISPSHPAFFISKRDHSYQRPYNTAIYVSVQRPKCILSSSSTPSLPPPRLPAQRRLDQSPPTPPH